MFKLNIKQNLHKSIKEHYSKVTSQNKKLIKLNPYVKDTLEWLKKNYIKIGIVTSKDKIRTEELVEYYQLDIETLVTPEMTKFGKPSSQPILYAANKLGVSIDQILFIGDMQSDMECAFNSGCLYLHYLNGYQYLNYQLYGGQITSIIEIIEYLQNY